MSISQKNTSLGQVHACEVLHKLWSRRDIYTKEGVIEGNGERKASKRGSGER